MEKCRVILNLVDAAESSLTEDQSVPRGRIRLALPLSFGLQQLVPSLLDFAQAQPHVELLLNFSERRSNLIEQGIDLALRITADLQPGDIVRKLGECRLLTTAAPAYLALHGEPRHPSALQHHECLVYSMTSSASNWAYQVQGKTETFPVRGRITADNGLVLLQASARGMGISLQPDFLVQPFLARQELVEILPTFAPPALGIYAVLPSNRYIPHRVGVLMEHLARALGKRPT